MKLRTHLLNSAFFFLCALFIAAPTMGAQVYEFEFITPAPGFGGELFFNAPLGQGSVEEILGGNSFITTPDGTFTVSDSVRGGPIILYPPPPPVVWGPDGITYLNLALYESHGTQLYFWTATPTSISDSPAGAIPLDVNVDPSASGTWVYVGAVPEPSASLLMVLGFAVIFVGPFRRAMRSS
jgi:hypothetical protein